MVGIGPDDISGAKLIEGEGCEVCKGTGFKGRVGIFEMIVATREFKHAVAVKADYKEMLKLVREQGFETMLEDGKDKVLSGVTTPSEVIKAVFTQALE